ncbi:MAG TPA: LemA family protein [Cyclobacteriaceae bacterium]|mgnify:FL=1|jgi:LemA protein|nr:LemA family protein [Cytophagales bacterium]HNT51082.1 LemA family protein [Cyclobacteriaceae bacterium]HRE65524.1 LemA family protein [Cyclobacteriaceae bacterium]HRF32558.1 LemA family protein [Cyclobacteriaceae bacterium]
MEILKKFGIWIFLGLLVIWGISMYNGMARLDQTVKQAWGDVESDYQRRSDLIPNLVNTVKGYADFEQETLTKVVEARASATQVKIDASNLTPENLQAFQQAQGGLNSALGRLLAVAENYPDLKANQNFLDLQSQLEGTENRISVSRKRFNDAVGSYNRAIVGFPRSLIANIGGYTEKGYFKAEEGAEKAPEVKF